MLRAQSPSTLRAGPKIAQMKSTGKRLPDVAPIHSLLLYPLDILLAAVPVAQQYLAEQHPKETWMGFDCLGLLGTESPSVRCLLVCLAACMRSNIAVAPALVLQDNNTADPRTFQRGIQNVKRRHEKAISLLQLHSRAATLLLAQHGCHASRRARHTAACCLVAVTRCSCCSSGQPLQLPPVWWHATCCHCARERSLLPLQELRDVAMDSAGPVEGQVLLLPRPNCCCCCCPRSGTDCQLHC